MDEVLMVVMRPLRVCLPYKLLRPLRITFFFGVLPACFSVYSRYVFLTHRPSIPPTQKTATAPTTFPSGEKKKIEINILFPSSKAKLASKACYKMAKLGRMFKNLQEYFFLSPNRFLNSFSI